MAFRANASGASAEAAAKREQEEASGSGRSGRGRSTELRGVISPKPLVGDGFRTSMAHDRWWERVLVN